MVPLWFGSWIAVVIGGVAGAAAICARTILRAESPDETTKLVA